MKTLHSIRNAVGLLFCLFPFCLTARSVPYLLEVKKDTPLFSQPSVKSQRLAEAEEGTLLLYVEKSKKSIWVKLRDSDGLEGWMPIDRTDYKEVDEARTNIQHIQKISSQEKEHTQERQKSKEEMMEEALRARLDKPFVPSFRIAPLMRWLSDSEPASSRIGLRVDYNLANTSLNGNGALNPAWLSAEATFPSPFISRTHSDFTAALRYVWRAPLWGPLLYGPDMGYSVDNVGSSYRHHFSFGMAAGVAVGPVDLMLRGAYDFFARSRAMAEIQLGVSF